MLRRMTLASVFGGEAAAAGRRMSRKSSQRPLSAAQTVSPTYDVESNLSKGQRRYQVASKPPRRGSKWLPSIFSENPAPSPNLTIGSEGSVNQAVCACFISRKRPHISSTLICCLFCSSLSTSFPSARVACGWKRPRASAIGVPAYYCSSR